MIIAPPRDRLFWKYPRIIRVKKPTISCKKIPIFSSYSATWNLSSLNVQFIQTLFMALIELAIWIRALQYWAILKSFQTMAFEFSGLDILSISSSESSLIYLYYASLFIVAKQPKNNVLESQNWNSFELMERKAMFNLQCMNQKIWCSRSYEPWLLTYDN